MRRVGDILTITGTLRHTEDHSRVYVHPDFVEVSLPVSSPLSKQLEFMKSHRRSSNLVHQGYLADAARVCTSVDCFLL